MQLVMFFVKSQICLGAPFVRNDWLVVARSATAKGNLNFRFAVAVALRLRLVTKDLTSVGVAWQVALGKIASRGDLIQNTETVVNLVLRIGAASIAWLSTTRGTLSGALAVHFG